MLVCDPFLLDRLALAFFRTQVNGRVGPANFRQFLEEMSASHFTATFEYLDVRHQHVELFPFSQSTFRFIAFTSTSDVSLLCCDVEAGMEYLPPHQSADLSERNALNGLQAWRLPERRDSRRCGYPHTVPRIKMPSSIRFV